MHLIDILAVRQVPAAGLYLSLTRRCPLSCAHCSTNSTMQSEEYSGDRFLRFVETFTPAQRPDVLVLTGGEPLVRPRLVDALVTRAQAVGTRIVLASGMFFAREPQTPPLIEQVLAKVDHFTVSLDVFHEQQVPRAAVFRVIQSVLDRGQSVSFLVVGLNEQDPYLDDVIGDIRRQFDDRAPILVGMVGAVGRAKEWMDQAPAATRSAVDPFPCDMAAWPVVTYDGTVVACCNQQVVDGPVPPHLRLGHTTADDWATVRERYLGSPMLRAIRLFGPQYLAARHGGGALDCDGYCPTCFRLSDDPEIARQIEPLMARPSMQWMAEHVIGLQREQFVARHATSTYAHLASLGYAAQAAAAPR